MKHIIGQLYCQSVGPREYLINQHSLEIPKFFKNSLLFWFHALVSGSKYSRLLITPAAYVYNIDGLQSDAFAAWETF